MRTSNTRGGEGEIKKEPAKGVTALCNTNGLIDPLKLSRGSRLSYEKRSLRVPRRGVQVGSWWLRWGRRVSVNGWYIGSRYGVIWGQCQPVSIFKCRFRSLMASCRWWQPPVEASTDHCTSWYTNESHNIDVNAQRDDVLVL